VCRWSSRGSSPGNSARACEPRVSSRAFALIATSVADPRSPLYGLAPSAVRAEGGVLQAGTKRDGYADVVARSGQPELTAEVSTKEKAERAKFALYSFGAQFVEVKVDEALGLVRVTRAVGAFAGGKILNEKTARSQLEGGMIWGLGMALFEHTARDPRSGRAMTRDLADYHIPVHADVPALEAIMVDEVDPYVSEIGAKGIGEIGITGINAAVANAVYHATGKRVRDLPITLDKLL